MRYLSLCSIMLLAICGQSQPKVNPEQKAVQDLVVNFFDALAKLDVEKLKTYCAAQVTILESGEVWNYDSLALRITGMKDRAPDFKRVNKIDFLKTVVSGNTAWTYYLNEATVTFSGNLRNIKWIESVVASKIAGVWKIDLLHSTALESPPK